MAQAAELVAPHAPPRAIDREHFARMSAGDRALEREVLALFARQAGLLVARMDGVAPACLATLAHTLKGSARGIGAWAVARAADALEDAAGPHGSPAAVALAIAELRAAVAEARADIAAWLGGA